jgi:hypothetical protein
MARTMIQLDSGVLHSATYDEDSETLDILFRNGRVYILNRVPKNVFEGLRDAPSPGSYFNSELKGKYI